jgi:hypothetical protein
MSDVFISYARSTAKRAQQVAEALRRLGYEVWRDDELPAHRSYTDVIAERLRAAKAVVVIWPAEAVKSEWVQSEADGARADHKLVQLSIDGAPLPMPFDRIQRADLVGWSGDVDAPGWRKVVASIRDLAGVAGLASTPSPSKRPGTAAPLLAVPPLTTSPAIRISPISPTVAALAALGETDRAKDWMRRALLIDLDNNVMHYNFACTLAVWLGDPEAPLAMLGPAWSRTPAAW